MERAMGARLRRAFAVAAALAVPAGLATPARAACTGFGPGASWAAGASPQAVVSADFDRDGIADLAIASLSAPTLVVLRGTGGGAIAAPAYFDVGASARALAVSDFNADGIADLCVGVNAGITIALGNGDGTFTIGATLPAGAAVRGVACADFDRDGIMDLAATSSGTDAVLVLRGHGTAGIGDGTFATPVAYAVGANPARLLAADVDGDGITDLVVANNGGASVSVLRGLGTASVGNGAFAPATTIPVAGSPWGVAAFDWSGDGVPDLVVSNGAGTSVTLLRGASGGFTNASSVTTPTAPRDLVAGDFDGDGRTDVAAACAVGNGVVVLRGTGSGLSLLGTFATGPGASALVAGDWDGDGAPDLACGNGGGASITRLLGTCPAPAGAGVTLLAPLGGDAWWPGSVQEARWTRGPGVTSVNVDLSRDGGATWLPLAREWTRDRIAIPVVGAPDPHVRVRVADALVPARAAASPADLVLCGPFGAPIGTALGFTPTALASADLDGDGVPDAVVCGGARAVVLRGEGDGRFNATASFAEDSTRRVALADVSGDGFADLVRLTPSAVAVRAGDGRGGFGPESRRALAGGSGLAALDLDGDGIADVATLAADGGNARLEVWRSSAPLAPWSAAAVGAPGALVAADVDGDGVPDLVSGTGVSVQVWSGTNAGGRGDGTFSAGAARTLPAAAGDLALTDADGDGIPDVIACLPATGDLATLPSPAPSSGAGSAGANAFAAPLTVAAGARPFAPLAADLDGDGHADLVLALAGDDACAWLAGTGAGFAAPVRVALGTRAAALALDDFTRDGNPDLLVAGADGVLRCLAAPCPPREGATLAFAPATFADTSGALVGFARPLAWMRSRAIAAVRLELARGGAPAVPLADGVTANAWRWIASGPETPAARLHVRDAACGTRADAGAAFAIRDAFAPGRASAVAAGAARMAIADANGDGIADVALVAADRVQLLLGDGAGGYEPAWEDAEGAAAQLALADVDGDGVADLSTATAQTLSVRLGDGAGGFAAAWSTAAENGSRDVALLDTDGDGVADLVSTAGDGIANRLCVRRGLSMRGAPAFASPWYAALPAPPRALAIADVNGDGVPDAVVAHASGLATYVATHVATGGVFRLAGNRAFAAGHADAIAIADLDGDGRADVAAADGADGTLVLAAGDGAGGFGAPVTLAAGGTPVAIAIADVDRDGAADLVVTLADGTLALWRGVPGNALATRFAPAARLASGGGGGAALALLDADGDGSADALTLDAAGALHVRAGHSAPAGAPRLVAAPATSAAIGRPITLHWQRPAGVDAVDVELSRDDGRTWRTLAPAVTGEAWTWNVSGPGTYAARLRVRDTRVAAAVDSASAPFRIDASVAGVAPDVARLTLGAPHPNPARGLTRFELSLPAAGFVRADVCDVAGRRARALVSGEFAAGGHALAWDGRDDEGRILPAGLYFVRVHTAAGDAVRRVVLAR